MNERTARVASRLSQKRLDCLLVTKMENIRYLTGFSGSSAFLAVSSENAVLVTDGRYTEQARQECPGLEVKIYTENVVDTIARLLPAGKAGFENTISYDLYSRLSGALREDTSLEPVDGSVEELRAVKDPGEVELIQAAAGIAGEGFNQILPLVKPGISERELAARLDYRMMLAGADRPAFETIVASGPNSSMPHAGITDRKLREGDLVVIDFGAEVKGYKSDTTRTVKIPPVSENEEKVYRIVGEAVEKALETVKDGVSAASVDSAARDYIENLGYGGNFNHSLGHGVGLEAHEKPTLSSRSGETLEEGMVFTIEPGIYLPGSYGVRIEEMVLLKNTGPELLTSDF